MILKVNHSDKKANRIVPGTERKQQPGDIAKELIAPFQSELVPVMLYVFLL